MYSALLRYYKYLDMRLVTKVLLNQDLIEKSRSNRVDKNFATKRKEKGLVTVIESVNETDPNKTSMKDSRTRGGVTGGEKYKLGKEATINEEREDGGRRGLFS